MELHKLTKINKRSAKRIGRGYGSGKAKTSGRGTKGTKARGSVPLYFEGGALPLIKRLPVLRGKGRNKSFKQKPFEVNLSELNNLPKNTIVDISVLLKNNIVEKDAEKRGVKILGNGEISKALTFKVPATIGARKKIEEAGGEVVSNNK